MTEVSLDRELEEELLLSEIKAEIELADSGARRFQRGDICRVVDKLGRVGRVVIVTGFCPSPERVHTKFWIDGKKRAIARNVNLLKLVAPAWLSARSIGI